MIYIYKALRALKACISGSHALVYVHLFLDQEIAQEQSGFESRGECGAVSRVQSFGLYQGRM